MSLVICDFCDEPSAAYKYPTRPFTINDRLFHADWFICIVCAELIDDDNWAHLLVRALKALEVPVNERQVTSFGLIEVWSHFTQSRLRDLPRELISARS